MRRRSATAAACGLLAATFLGCDGPGTRPRVWATHDMVRLTRQTPATGSNPLWDDRTGDVNLFAAANETVAFQLVIDAPAGGLRGLSVTCGRLVAPEGHGLPEAAVRLFRMLCVPIRSYPAWYLRLTDGPTGPVDAYDVLVPTEAGDGAPELHLAGGQRLALWVDVDVPRDALPDDYRAEIRVRYHGGRAEVGLRLKVYDFVLPDIRPVRCVGSFSYKTVFRRLIRRGGPGGRDEPFVPAWLDTTNPNVRDGLTAVRHLMRLAHAHRLDLFDRDLRPPIKRDRDGAASPRWREYDAIVTPYLDGTAFDDRLGVSAWPAPLWADWPPPRDYGGRQTKAYRDTIAALAARSAEHFRRLGMARKLFVWPRTGAAGGAAYARHAAFARLVRHAAPALPLLSELPPGPPAPTGWAPPKGFDGLVDLAAPRAELADVAGAARMGHPAKPLVGLYLRPGRPPHLGSCGVFADPADVRALAWAAMKYRCAGLFIPEVLNWRGDPYVPSRGRDRLFYPRPAADETAAEAAAPAILASVRLKWLRRGLQDAGYLWLLRQRQRGAVADGLIGALVRYAGRDAAGDHYRDGRLDGWVHDGAAWVRARRLMAEEIRAVLHPERLVREDLLAQRVAWQKLQQLTCRVRLERLRTRFEVAGRGRYRAVVRAELYNELRRPVDASLKVMSLPAGWTGDTVAQRLSQMAPDRRASVELSVRGDHVRTGAYAKMALPLVLETSLRGPRTFLAEVPFLLVGHTARAPEIDGDVRDWPLRPGNAAGRFRLLGRRGRPTGDAGAAEGDRPDSPWADTRRGLAARQTSVFALHDGRTLFLAFRCEEPDLDGMRARPTNIVRYDRMLAVGEDLVEMIADPGRDAKGPEDLYHLVIKCNGVTVSERGVSTDPPVGRVRPWPAGARVAVGRYEGFWVAEAALPLASFGEGASRGLWGVNFARFRTAGSEASNWAGASRYYYHPDNLGTMYLVPKGMRVPLRPASAMGRAGG